MLSAASKLVKQSVAKFSVPLMSFCLLIAQVTSVHGTRKVLFKRYSSQTTLAAPRCDRQASGVLCENVENYPTPQLDQLINRHVNRNLESFGVDFVVNIGNQFDDSDESEQSLCKCKQRLIFPQAGETKDHALRFIVNHDKFKQGVRVEECMNPARNCTKMARLPNGYESYCEQKYIYRSLLSLSLNETIVKELFRLPSCCQCMVRSIHPSSNQV